MYCFNKAIRLHRRGAILICCLLGLLLSFPGVAQTREGFVPITKELEHKIRLDNGKVRLIEVALPKGKATLFHEHRADAFFAFTGAFASRIAGNCCVAYSTGRQLV